MDIYTNKRKVNLCDIKDNYNIFCMATGNLYDKSQQIDLSLNPDSNKILDSAYDISLLIKDNMPADMKIIKSEDNKLLYFINNTVTFVNPDHRFLKNKSIVIIKRSDKIFRCIIHIIDNVNDINTTNTDTQLFINQKSKVIIEILSKINQDPLRAQLSGEGVSYKETLFKDEFNNVMKQYLVLDNMGVKHGYDKTIYSISNSDISSTDLNVCDFNKYGNVEITVKNVTIKMFIYPLIIPIYNSEITIL